MTVLSTKSCNATLAIRDEEKLSNPFLLSRAVVLQTISDVYMLAAENAIRLGTISALNKLSSRLKLWTRLKPLHLLTMAWPVFMYSLHRSSMLVQRLCVIMQHTSTNVSSTHMYVDVDVQSQHVIF